MPGELSSLQPQVRFRLIDEARCKDLNQDDNLVALLFQMAHASGPEEFNNGLEKLKPLIQNNAELTHSVLFWLDVMLRKRGIEGLRYRENLSNEDWTMGYKWGIEIWMENKQKEVEHRKSCQILQKLLTIRFGPLSADRIELINQASLKDLDIWTERVLSAKSLMELFEPGQQLVEQH
jgi:hypothetical protein